MESKILPIRHPRAPVQVVKGGHHPVTVLVEQEQAMQLLKRLHTSGKGLLQARLYGGAEAIYLDPICQTGQHQISLEEGVLGLLGHGPGQGRRSDAGRLQVVTARLLQLQVKQTAQAQAHRRDKRHRCLEQRQALQGTTRDMERIENRDRQANS